MKYKYIHIINSLDLKYGGPSVVISNLALSQKKLGHDVSIISTYLNDKEFNDVQNQIKYLIENDLNVFLFKAFSFYRLSLGLIKVLLASDKKAIFYFHGLYRWPTTIGAYICRLNNLSYVIRVHGALDPYLFRKSLKGKTFYFLKKLSEKLIDFKNLKEANWIHVTSKNELDKLPSDIRYNSTTKIIPNGISLSIKNESINLRKKYKLSENNIILLYLGRINEKKGLDILIKSFPYVYKQIKNVSLLIVGPDNENYIKKLDDILIAINPKIRKNILIDSLVSRSYIKAYCKQANLFILPSRSENFGMSVIESIYFGVPSLVTKNVDIYKELIKYNVVNIIEELTPLKLSESIIHSINDDSLKSIVKNTGSDVINKLYSWNQIAYEIDRLTSKLCTK